MLKEVGTRLNQGIPFSVDVGGKAVYTGKITFTGSSFRIAEPVIVMGINVIDHKLTANQPGIDLGYPARNAFHGKDPRGDERNPHRFSPPATGKTTGGLNPQPYDKELVGRFPTMVQKLAATLAAG